MPPPRLLTFNVSLVSLMACRSASENLVGGAPDSEDGAGEGGTGSSPSGGAPATAAAGSAILSEGGGGGGSSLSSGLAFFEGDDDWSFREDVYTRRGGLALLITTGQGSRGPRSIGSRSLPAGTLLSAYQRSRRFNSKCRLLICFLIVPICAQGWSRTERLDREGRSTGLFSSFVKVLTF